MTTYRECSDGHEAIQVPEGMDCPKCEDAQLDNKVGTRVPNLVYSEAEKEAQEIDKGIEDSLNVWIESGESLSTWLILANEKEIWATLGYRSKTDYFSTRFPQSRRHIYRMLQKIAAEGDLKAITGEDISLTFREAKALSSPEAQEQVKTAIEEGADPQEAVKQATKSLPRKPDPNVTDPNQEYEESKQTENESTKPELPEQTEELEQNANTPTGSIYIDSSNKETRDDNNTPQSEKPKASHVYPPDFEGTVARLPGFVRRAYPRITDVEAACHEAGVEPKDLYERFCDFYRGSHSKYGWTDPGKAFFNNYHRTLAQIRRDQQPQQPPKDVCSHCGVGYVPGVGYMKFNLESIKAAGQFDHIPVSENGYYTNVPDDYLVEAQSGDA